MKFFSPLLLAVLLANFATSIGEVAKASCAKIPDFMENNGKTPRNIWNIFRVLNGPKAEEAIPWQVHYEDPNGSCGGTILSPYHILTAAHCLDDLSSIESIKIKAGSHNQDSFEQERGVEKFVIHGKYKWYSIERGYDLAILKLKSPLVFNDNVQNACLPEPNENPIFKACYASGWGQTETGTCTYRVG